jgi:hypothetical protein
MNASGRKSTAPLEHIYFNDQSMPSGQYRVTVVLYDWRNQPQNPVAYRLEILRAGNLPTSYEGILTGKGDSKSYTFTYP